MADFWATRRGVREQNAAAWWQQVEPLTVRRERRFLAPTEIQQVPPP